MEEEDGVTLWSKIEPIEFPFTVIIPCTPRLRVNDPKHKKSKDKVPVTQQRFYELVRLCIEIKKMSFTDTVLYLGVSPTTVRRVCRTLKIGRYREQVPSDIPSKSSQIPFGWNSVNGFLEKNPEERRCVEMMFKFREEGKSLHWIAAEMTRRGIKTKNGGKWHAKTVSQILELNKKFKTRE